MVGGPDGTELAQLGGAPDPPVVAAAFGEGLEDSLRHQPVMVVRKLGVDFVGMPRERFRHPTHALVVTQVERFALLVIFLPAIPGAHQRVLKNRQLIGIVADVVEELLQQAGRDLAPAHLDRTGDRTASLIAIEPRDEVLAVIHGLGQAGKLRTVPQVIRAHGERHVDRHLGLLSGPQKQLDEGSRLFHVFRAAAPEAKDLLELIDHHQEVAPLLHLGLAHRLHQAEAAAAQGRPRFEDRGLALRIVEVGFHQGPGEMRERIPARTHDRHFPLETGLQHGPTVKVREEPGLHQ